MSCLFDDARSYFEFYSLFGDYNRRLAKVIKASIQRTPKTILDLACGVGLSTESLLHVFRESTAIGIDISADMIDFAKERCSDADSSYHTKSIDDLLKNPAPWRCDLVFVKSALHLFRGNDDIESLLQLVGEHGSLVICERTARSAQSYPLFPPASQYWTGFFRSRCLLPKLRQLHTERTRISVSSYGEFVNLPGRQYFNAISKRQHSFLDPFRQDYIEDWIQSSEIRDSEVQVFEAYWIYTIYKLCEET